MPAHVMRHCVRVLIEQERFYADSTLLSVSTDAFTYEYLDSLGVTALGTQ